jgi:hypothetical protein
LELRYGAGRIRFVVTVHVMADEHVSVVAELNRHVAPAGLAAGGEERVQTK